MVSEISMNKAWEKMMKIFLETCKSQNVCGREYFFLTNCILQIKNYNLESFLSPQCLWQLKSKEYYISQISTPGKYSEMQRLYAYGDKRIDQYKWAVDAIKKRKSIKPIVLSIYDPYKDHRDNVTTPCINNIVIDVNHNTINMYTYYSTMNLFRMGLFDIIQMGHLHHKIAKDSNKKVGTLNIFINKVYMPIFDYMISMEIFNNKG